MSVRNGVDRPRSSTSGQVACGMNTGHTR
uniref:Uncharacterized protein n=1 Tax=Arundo donax TaxID=35708 RepID=A0A0A8XYB3_ARUDO